MPGYKTTTKNNLWAWCGIKQSIAYLLYSVIHCVTEIYGKLHASSKQRLTMKKPRAYWEVIVLPSLVYILQGDRQLLPEWISYFTKRIKNPTKSLQSRTKCLKNSSCCQVFLWCNFLYLSYKRYVISASGAKSSTNGSVECKEPGHEDFLWKNALAASLLKQVLAKSSSGQSFLEWDTDSLPPLLSPSNLSCFSKHWTGHQSPFS